MRIILFCLFLVSGMSPLFAQQTSADKIIAVVGKNRIILSSELEQAVAQQRQEMPAFDDSMKCMLLQQMMVRKLLVEQADRDSVFISDEELEGNLENRMRYFVRLYGSKERVEQASGKTMYQMKEDFRDPIREQMLEERVKGTLLSNVKVTPMEVREFYAKLSQDTLPFFPATVEMGQIVLDPPVSPELDAYARQKLEDIRKQIVTDGQSFESMAGVYSDDGTRDNGGDLGTLGRADLVPEFASAAFRLQNGEISPIVKTRYGYHIIQMVSRQGDKAHLRHILVRVERSSADFKAAMSKLDSVRSQLVAGTIQFPAAVAKYSTDDASKMTGGMITDASTGATRLEIDKLDPALALMVDSLSPGSYSQPQLFTTETGTKSCRIVYMRGRTEPHKANLKDDYANIQDVALAQKKADRLQAWIAEKRPTYYVRLAPEYQNCGPLAVWTTSAK